MLIRRLTLVFARSAGFCELSRHHPSNRQRAFGRGRGHGIGVINRGTRFGRDTHVFIMLDIQLYDGRSLETREPATSSRLQLSRLTSGVGPPTHAGDVDNSAFPLRLQTLPTKSCCATWHA